MKLDTRKMRKLVHISGSVSELSLSCVFAFGGQNEEAGHPRSAGQNAHKAETKTPESISYD